MSILKDQIINPIVVIENYTNEHGIYNWEVIDGKQRLTTIFAYLKNEFAIIYEGTVYFFSDLPKDCQDQIENYDRLRFDVHYNYKCNISDQIKISLFEDINWLGTPQDIKHLKKLKKI